MPRVTRSLQPYLKKSGGTMTGNLDMDAFKIFGDNLVWLIGDASHYANLACINSVSFFSLISAPATGLVAANNRAGGSILFRTQWGGLQTCAELVSLGINNGAWRVPRLGDVTVLPSMILNFGDNPILYSPFKHICPFALIGGATDVFIETIPSGEMTQDLHVDKVIVSIDQPAGAGKTVTVEISDGTNTMTVTITGDTDVKGSTTTNNFDLDVSAESLTIHYSQTAGGAATAGTIICLYHLITNV